MPSAGEGRATSSRFCNTLVSSLTLDQANSYWNRRTDGYQRVNDKLEGFFKASGLKVARQNFQYKSAGETYAGQNIYAILHAPRGDATEAIVIVAAWRNVEGALNRSGVTLILTLARYFKSMRPSPWPRGDIADLA